MGGIKLGGRFLDSATIRDRAARAASGLAAIGVREGDVVALDLRNDFAFFEASLAAAMLGAYATPLNWHCSADEAGYILTDCGAKALVIHADLQRKIAAAIPAATRVFPVDTPAEIAGAYAIAPDCMASDDTHESWDALIERSPPVSRPHPRAPASMIYTSGTTGRPKGVCRALPTPEQVKATAAMRALMYGAPENNAVAIVTGPVYHSAPNAFALWMFAMGATIVLQPRFDARELLALIERERATHIHMVPTMFVRLLKLPEEERRRSDVSSLRHVIHGAAPCPQYVKCAMIEWWGPVVVEYYASTETTCITLVSAAEWLQRPGTVGRSIPGAEIQILDAQGTPVAPGITGEIACRNHALADFTYHGSSDQRREADRNGLVSLGDVGHLDSDGYLYLSDRVRDMINSGGVNIYPAEVEAVLHQAPGVADCAVFGIPDEEFGERVHAVVQPAPGAAPDEESLRQFLRARLARHKVPRRIDFAGALPREDSGKIFKARLRAPFWAAAGRNI